MSKPSERVRAHPHKRRLPLIPPARFAAAALARSQSAHRAPAGLLAVDFSPLRAGVACCDAGLSVIFPVGCVEPPSADKVLAMAVKHGALGGIVVGWPLELDGSEGASCQRVLRFAKQLADKATVTLWDERFTSFRAKRERTTASRDAVAACHILNDFLLRFEAASSAASGKP